MKYLKRILGLPFFLMLNIIGIIFHLFKISRAFILYGYYSQFWIGGEAMAYDKKTTPKMIADIYFELEKCRLEKSKTTQENEKSLKDSLWQYLSLEHDLTLLDSEVYEIIHLIDKFRSENQS